MSSPTAPGFLCLFKHRLFWIKAPVIPPFRGWLADTALARKPAKNPSLLPSFYQANSPCPVGPLPHRETPAVCDRQVGQGMGGAQRGGGKEKAAHRDNRRSPASQSSNSHVLGGNTGHARLLERVAQLPTLHCFGKPQSTLRYQSLKGGEAWEIVGLSCKL